MSTTVTVPIGIRVDFDTLAYHEHDVIAALRAATTRALANAATKVPAGHAWAEYVQVRWWGDAYDETDKDLYEARGAAIRTTIRDLARKQGIELRVRPPSLDVTATSEQLASPDASVRAGAFTAIAKRVEDGEWEAFWLALLAIRPDDAPPTGAAFIALGVLHHRDPATFAQYLEDVLGDTPLVTIRRLDRDVFIDHRVWVRRPALAGAMRVARRYPPVAQGRLRATPSLTRVLGLLDAQRAVFVDLAAEADHAWRADRATRETIGSRAQTTQDLAGILFAYAADPRVQRLLGGLEPDIVENVRWLGWALSELRRLAAILDLYEEIYDIPAADTQEEVQILAEAQSLILREIAENPLPRAAIAGSLQARAEEALAGWQLAAADRRVARLTREAHELADAAGQLQVINPGGYGYFERAMSWDPAHDVRVPYASRLAETQLMAGELEAAVAVAAHRRQDLDTLMALDRQRDLVAYRLLILAYWQATFELRRSWTEHDIGDADDKLGWLRQVGRIQNDMLAAYDTPDLGGISSRAGEWHGVIDGIQSDLQYKAQLGQLESLGITIIVFLVTHKLARFLPETISATRLALIQTAGVTALDLGATALAPHARVPDPSAVLNGLVDTFASFGVLGIVNELATVGALRFLRGRQTGQMVAILATDAVAATALPVVVEELKRGDDRRHWSDQDAGVIVGGLLLNAAMGAFGAQRMSRALRAREAADLLTSVESLQLDVVAYATELGDTLQGGPLSRRGFGRLRTRGVQLFGRLRGALERLAALPAQTFAAPQEVRAALLKEAAGFGEIEAYLRKLPAPQTLGPGPPAEVLPDAVVARGGGVFEYDPARPASSPQVLERRLRAAGYDVHNDAGVLLLAPGPDAPAEYRLIPAPAAPAARPASAVEQGAMQLVLAAAGPGEPRVRELLTGPSRDPLLAAAQLEPDLLRSVIVADAADEPAALRRLEQALRDDGMTTGRRGEPVGALDRALQAAGAAASARRAASAAGPYGDLVATAGDRPPARAALATADGQALLEAAKLAPVETKVAVATGLAVDELEATWVAKGLPADRVRSARLGLEALLRAKADIPLAAEQAIAEAAGGDTAQPLLERLHNENPLGYQALMEAYAREPDLVRRAIRATEMRTLVDTLSELARRLHPTYILDEYIFVVGETIRALNAGRRARASELAGLEAIRELLPAADPDEAGELARLGYLPALRVNPRVRAFAQQRGAAMRLRRLVGQGGLTSRFGIDPFEVFGVLERVLVRHASDPPARLGELVDSLASPLSELSDADIRRVAGEVDPQAQALLDRLNPAELELLRLRDLTLEQQLDPDAAASLYAKFSDAELEQVLEALFPGIADPVVRVGRRFTIGGRTIRRGRRGPGGEIQRPGAVRMDAADVALLPGETPRDAVDRVATVIGVRIADSPMLDNLWTQARATVLHGRDPHRDVTRAEMLRKGGIYDSVRDEFWRLVRLDGPASFFLRIRGFDLAGTGAPLIETKAGSTLSVEARRVSLDHMEGFEKATGTNYRFAVDSNVLSFEFQYPNTLRDAIGRRLKLGSYAPKPGGLP